MVFLSNIIEPPTAEEFLINIPLYEVVSYADDKLEKGLELLLCFGAFDFYCPDCNQHSIFHRLGGYNKGGNYPNNTWVDKGKFNIELTCSRNSKHTLFFQFIAKGKTIQKIGQLPSIASLNLYDVKKYSKVIDSKYFKEFTKAIGLASHGVGVGSFVYLRRIFEFLIEDAHNELKTSSNWDESAYLQARMNDKIEILKEKLPDFLVENKAMYSILSKGIHELDENDCLIAFPIIKIGIEIILDSKLEKMNREKKLKDAQKAISALHSTI